MRTRHMLVAFAAAAAAAGPGFSGVAHALVPPTGPKCQMQSLLDPTSQPNTYTGVISAGPLAAAGTTMTVYCSVQVGGTGVHSDPDALIVQNGPSQNAVTLPPTLVSYVAPLPNDPVYVCTHVYQVDLNVPYDLYWDDPSQSWSLNPLTAQCALYTGPGTTNVPVTGGIFASVTTAAVPQAAPYGVLADPNQWTCNVPAYSPSTPWTITCTPVTSTTWTCAIVYAYAMAATPGSVGRTTLDCDGSNPPEAQSPTVTGPANWNGVAAVSGVAATTFTCTFDNGGSAGPVADFFGFCGDPGLPGVR